MATLKELLDRGLINFGTTMLALEGDTECFVPTRLEDNGQTVVGHETDGGDYRLKCAELTFNVNGNATWRVVESTEDLRKRPRTAQETQFLKDMIDLELDKLLDTKDSYHIEMMCKAESKLLKTFTKEQKRLFTVVSNMNAVHEQLSGKIIFLHQKLDELDGNPWKEEK